jgi:hypothetical protein
MILSGKILPGKGLDCIEHYMKECYKRKDSFEKLDKEIINIIWNENLYTEEATILINYSNIQ